MSIWLYTGRDQHWQWNEESTDPVSDGACIVDFVRFCGGFEELNLLEGGD